MASVMLLWGGGVCYCEQRAHNEIDDGVCCQRAAVANLSFRNKGIIMLSTSIFGLQASLQGKTMEEIFADLFSLW